MIFKILASGAGAGFGVILWAATIW